METRLVLVNQTEQTQSFLLYQRCATSAPSTRIAAWVVSPPLAPNQSFNVDFPSTVQVSASDSSGNSTPRIDADLGERFHVAAMGRHIRIQSSEGGDPSQIHVINNSAGERINATVARAKRRIATWRSVEPRATVSFALEPAVYVGLNTLGIRSGILLPESYLDENHPRVEVKEGVETRITLLSAAGESLSLKIETGNESI